MNKYTKIILIILTVLILLGGGIFGYQKYQEYYHDHYIVIDDVEYSRSITTLDLSGTTIGEFVKLYELTQLESLNLRNTGISAMQYRAVSAALPGCTIFWSVPFQNDYLDSEVTELDLVTLNPEDLQTLAYLPRLTDVKVDTISNLSVIDDFRSRYPNLTFTYNIEVNGEWYSSTTDTLNLDSVSIEELMEKLPYLPNVTTVKLTGQIPPTEEMMNLRQTFDHIIFDYDFEVFGVATNSTADFLDLSEIKFSGPEEVEAILPQFYNLTKVDMIHCGLSNEEMEALNNRHPETLFVWTVKISWKEMRTDITNFMPVKDQIWMTNASSRDLRYFTELIALDLGHMGITRCDFVAYMPKLKYLIMADTELADLTPLTGLTNLIFLELFICPFKDYTPLTTLTGLEDLNISYTYGDPYIITEMTWLKRLWFAQTASIAMDEDAKQALREALPNTEICFVSRSATGAGWRFGQHYKDMRDIFGVKYMVS